MGLGVWIEAARATIIDSGDVVLSGNDLAIGNTLAGSRAVDAEADGPYDSVAIGVGEGVAGTLTLDHAARFSTTGALVAGDLGTAVLGLDGESVLETAGASLDTSQVSLGGGSSWINDGLMSLHRSVDIVVDGGSSLSTVGFDTPLESFLDSNVTITGPGTSWHNDGALSIRTDLSFSLLDGATARDAGVSLNGFSAAQARLVVDGPGSSWDTGRFSTGLFYANGDILSITNGGRVNSSSVLLGGSGADALVDVLVDGPGSTWSIANELETHADVLTLRITGGAMLENGDANISNGFFGHAVDVSGSGSLWRSNGDLDVSIGGGGVPSLFDVREGGNLLVEGDTVLRYFGNPSGALEVSVRDAGSLFRTGGSLSLTGGATHTVPTSRLLVENGGRAEAGLLVEVFEGAEIALHGGTLATPLVSLLGGRLIGDGLIDGDVLNAGHVAPGSSGGALEVSGDFEQTSDGTLVITLGGTQAGIDHALLDVLGTSLLSGALEVVLAAGFAPAPGHVFEVLRHGSVLGAFASFAGLDVGGGVTLVPHYGPDSFWLQAVPEPATGTLVAIGLLVLGARSRRSRR